MNKRKFLILLVTGLVIIATTTIIFAQSDSIETHEYNFLNKAFFNISDDLTNETEFKLSPFDSLEVGTYYEYPNQKVICSLYFVGADGVTDFEGHQENSAYEKIESNATSQGYRTYIFKDSNEYDVFIDLNNLSVDDRGIEMQYYYFAATFATLDEAKIFIDSFKINETTKIQ